MEWIMCGYGVGGRLGESYRCVLGKDAEVDKGRIEGDKVDYWIVSDCKDNIAEFFFI